MLGRNTDMHKLEIRPGMWMAYEDHWFGEQWTVPETVVMVHGNSESSRAWNCWVPHLARKYRVLRPDLPGFGGSPAPLGYGWSTIELATHVGALLDALKIENCHLIGAKYGGSVCMQLAIDQPHRPLSLCLFGSPVQGNGSGNADMIRPRCPAMGRGHYAIAAGGGASEAQVNWWTNELMGKTAASAAYGASASRVDMELEDKLQRIAAPTLIVTTQESGLQSVEAVERYAQRIPNSRVIVLPGDRYHIAAVQPELCAQPALDFIQQVSKMQEGCRVRTRRAVIGGLTAFGAVTACSRGVRSGSLPICRPIRIIVPFAPGGGRHRVAAAVASSAEPVGPIGFVENRVAPPAGWH